MYQTTISAEQAIMSDSRWWNLILTDGRGHRLESKNGDIITMSHTIETSETDLTVGDMITQNLNIELLRDRVGDFVLRQYSVIHVEYELHDAVGVIPMGQFRIQQALEEAKKVRVNAKDFYHDLELNETYTSSLTYPATLRDVVQEICRKIGTYTIGVNFPYEKLYVLKDGTEDVYEELHDKADSCIWVKSDGSDLIVSQKINAKTMGEALRYCAAFAGALITQDRTGALSCAIPLRVPYTITMGRAAEPQMSAGSVVIGGLKCVVDDNTTLSSVNQSLIDSGAKIMEFECPIMTQAQLNKIAADWIGFAYRPATIDHRLGDPRLDILDVIGYKSMYSDAEYTMPIMSLDYSFDGGLRCNVQSTASN